MGVKFKCRLTGNVFEFQHEWDVEEMRKHPQYDEVEEIPDGLQTKIKKTTKEKVTKKEAK